MLGKGLESLIPKKKQQTDDQQPQPGEESFYSPKSDQPPIQSQEAADAFRTECLGAPPSSVSDEVGVGGARVKAAPTRWRSETAGSGRKASAATEAIFLIEVEKIKPNPHQPRRDFNEESLKELAASIQEFGILQPLIVSKIEKEVETGTEVEYELIAGERRLMAAKILCWERVPAIIKKIGQKSNQLEIAITENLQRTDLNPIETARAYAKLQDEFGLTQREIAQRLGKSRETIANTLRLLNLPSEIQEALAKNRINESQARLLLVIDDLNQQQNFFKEILNNNLSVRELRQRIRKTQFGEVRPPEIDDNLRRSNLQNIDPEIIDFQEKLTELLGAQVKINPPATGEKGGKIVITFYSPEEIQGIIEKLSPNDRVEE